MHHLIRDDSRGMVSVPEALWLQDTVSVERLTLRARVVSARLALAMWLAPPGTIALLDRRATLRIS